MVRIFRSIFFWLHLTVGVVAGLIILIMAVTGVLMTYERQIVEWMDGYKAGAPGLKADAISLEKLLARVPEHATAGPNPSGMVVLADEGAAIAVQLGREKQIFLHPASGYLLGEGSPRVRGFLKLVLGVHRWLGAQGDYKEMGGSVTKAANVGFLGLMVSGIFLWWPKHWSWRALHARTTMNFKIHGKARNWNWHHALGFWGIIPLGLIALTGLIMSYGWANDLLYTLTGTQPPPPRAAPQQGGGAPRGGSGGPGRSAPAPASAEPAPAPWQGLDAAWKLATAKVSGWESIQVRLPEKPGGAAVFSITSTHRGRPDKRSQLTVDLKSGNETGWETFATYNTGRQLRLWARWVHTGEAGGWIGQTLAGLASLAAALLVWTGLALTWRRFGKKKAA